MMREVEERAAHAYRRQYGVEPVIVASAPGRVNLIGEHTDYNGGFVLPCAIDRRVAVALGPGENELYSADFAERKHLRAVRSHDWADYPGGVVWAMTERQAAIPRLQAAFAGDVPRGSGLSSSAAIEAATALALNVWQKLELARTDLARLCQHAENDFVGVGSGIMDQFASLLCEPDSALLIDCDSLATEHIPLDLRAAGLSLLVCDTRVPRNLAATGYNTRHSECDRAAHELGLSNLRAAAAEDVKRLEGNERLRARHVVTENARVLAGVKALRERDFGAFGVLMYASHASLRDDFEVSTPELDKFVSVAEEAGALGARLTGAGFGGCAIGLIAEEKLPTLISRTKARFADQNFQQPAFYTVTPSAGAEIVMSNHL